MNYDTIILSYLFCPFHIIHSFIFDKDDSSIVDKRWCAVEWCLQDEKHILSQSMKVMDLLVYSDMLMTNADQNFKQIWEGWTKQYLLFFCLKDCMNNLLSKEWASYAKFSTSSHWLGSTSYSHIFLARLFATLSFERVAWKNWFYPTICMLLSSNQQSLYARCLYIHLKCRCTSFYSRFNYDEDTCIFLSLSSTSFPRRNVMALGHQFHKNK